MKGKLKKNITDEEMFQENLEKDKARFLELHKLREYDVKDGYVLQLNKKIDGFTEGYAEIDVYVFNNIDRADEFFEYIKKDRRDEHTGLETKPLSPQRRQRISGWSQPQMHVSK